MIISEERKGTGKREISFGVHSAWFTRAPIIAKMTLAHLDFKMAHLDFNLSVPQSLHILTGMITIFPIS